MARITPLDTSIADASKMRDPDQVGAAQTGGRRRNGRKSRKNRKSRKTNRKNRKSNRKNRKSNRKSRKGRKANRKNRKSNRRSRRNRGGNRQSGGRHMLHEGAPIGGPTMLLDPDMQAKAGTADFKANSGLMGMKGN
jgi:hypothetical protein